MTPNPSPIMSALQKMGGQTPSSMPPAAVANPTALLQEINAKLDRLTALVQGDVSKDNQTPGA